MLKTFTTRRVAGALVVGCVALAAGAVLADSPRWSHAGGSGPRAGMSRMVTEMDADHDGKVSRAEIESFLTARATEIDADKDGKITVDEVKAFMQKLRDKHLAERLARMDKDGDGVVTVKEFHDARLWSLARLDRNGDGMIDSNDVARGMRGHFHHRMGVPPRN